MLAKHVVGATHVDGMVGSELRDMTALTPAPRPMVVHGKQNDFRR